MYNLAKKGVTTELLLLSSRQSPDEKNSNKRSAGHRVAPGSSHVQRLIGEVAWYQVWVSVPVFQVILAMTTAKQPVSFP
jgi:hypothetical protein